MTQYPAYKSLDQSWLKTILDALPIEPRSEGKARKAKKYLEYSVVEAIPATIHAGRSAAAKRGGRPLAKLVQDELMMMWLSILPWRQRNLRECRIGGPVPNLFKGPIAPFSAVDKAAWVVEAERANPNAQFWQFKFSAAETKTGIDVEALLPRQLIGLLEGFLRHFRPQLLRGSNPCTLFVNGDGNEMTQQNVTHAISSLTLRYGGRRVTPHLFRDVVAFAWLKDHPGDYLSLSKLLWHSNINTTILYYGGRFNESSGVVAMENWRDEREARAA
jgi:integrase